MERIKLYNGVSVPMEGFGVFQVPEQDCEQVVRNAVKAGYRLIDTASSYQNEETVGRGIRGCGVAREELFITTKAYIQEMGYDRTMEAFERSRKKLGLEYLDLYLIHMPYGDYHGSWRAMEELLRAGKIRAIGVCNFLPDRLADLILSHEIVPAVNQMECHPFCQQNELRAFQERYCIKMMAWAPFAEGREGIFVNPVLAEIGGYFGKTPAQVILRWNLQKGVVVIPGSSNPDHIQENLDLFGFELTEEDMDRINALDRGEKHDWY